MATNENLIPIPGRLHSVATEGHVAGADEIFDDSLQKTQDVINAEIDEIIDDVALIDTTESSPAVVPGFDPQTDTVHVTAQTLSESQKAQVRNNIGLGDVDARISQVVASEASQRAAADSSLQNSISAEATARANAISAEASRAQAAESALQNNIEALTQSNIIVVADHTSVSSPDPLTIYREQGTNTYSDWMYQNGSWNKMAEYDNAIDDVPTAGSDNLVKSGGVKYEISQLESRFKFVDVEFFVDFQKYPLYTGVINTTSNCWTEYGFGIYVPLSDFGETESIKIKAKTSNSTMVAFVNSILESFVEGASIDYMNDYSTAITLAAGSKEIELPKPDGDGYLWVYVKNATNEDRTPEYIKCDSTKANYVQTDDYDYISQSRNAYESTKILGQTEFRNLYYTGTVESAFYGFVDFPNVGLLVDATGEIMNNSQTEHYRTTDYIPVTSSNKICYTELFPDSAYCGLCLYNSNKELIAHFGDNSEKGKYILQDLSSYAEAAYIRASTFRPVTSIQPWRSVVLVCSADFELANSPIDDLADLIEDMGQTFHIGAGQQYTTLRAGFAAAIAKPNSTVYVHPGNYDLLQEFASEISAATGDTIGLALGNGMKIIFYAGAYVTCMYQLSGNSAKDDWVYDYFNPLYASSGDFYIEGLNIKSSNTRYCVHDEMVGSGTYIHTYKDCNMYYYNNHENIKYVQCIGGGLGEHGRIVIDGGIYESKTDYGLSYDYANTPEKAQQPISYHNGAIGTADSLITVNNVYLKNYGYFRFSGYGPSQIASKAVVSGCSMGRETLLRNEGGDITATPFELTEFCCEVRNPEPNN